MALYKMALYNECTMGFTYLFFLRLGLHAVFVTRVSIGVFSSFIACACFLARAFQGCSRWSTRVDVALHRIDRPSFCLRVGILLFKADFKL